MAHPPPPRRWGGGVHTILPANQSSQVLFINRNATVKSSSINNIHLQQQLNVGFFILKLTSKHMLGNVHV